jgi:hypothetical protein
MLQITLYKFANLNSVISLSYKFANSIIKYVEKLSNRE